MDYDIHILHSQISVPIRWFISLEFALSFLGEFSALQLKHILALHLNKSLLPNNYKIFINFKTRIFWWELIQVTVVHDHHNTTWQNNLLRCIRRTGTVSSKTDIQHTHRHFPLTFDLSLTLSLSHGSLTLFNLSHHSVLAACYYQFLCSYDNAT